MKPLDEQNGFCVWEECEYLGARLLQTEQATSICVPIPGTCEYVTFHGNRKFAEVIKVMNLNIGRLFKFIHADPIQLYESLNQRLFKTEVTEMWQNARLERVK